MNALAPRSSPWGIDRLSASFRGVTAGRTGILILLCVAMAFASWPTAYAMKDAEYLGAMMGVLKISAGLVISYGATALGAVWIVNRLPSGSVRWWSALAAVLAVGAILYAGLTLLMFPNRSLMVSFWLVIEGLMEAGGLALICVLLTRGDHARALLVQEELDRLTLDRQLAETRVLTLQSQIEPHFLFNTLANLRRLIALDRAAGRAMTREFSTYLAATLPALRNANSTLGREIALTRAYLRVHEMRMGDRLRVSVDVPEALADIPFPPMMLVTLVENALKHGIAPLPEGGAVTIVAQAIAGRLIVEVRDTGAGIKVHAGAGLGIANTRARLQALHGAGARLRIRTNDSGGVTAAIEMTPGSTLL